MQQYLPFTVLKHQKSPHKTEILSVATVLTVYGIETSFLKAPGCFVDPVATVLTVYGIETPSLNGIFVK